MPPVKRFKYLPMLVDTFSGWVEAFPTTNKRASTVASLQIKEIILSSLQTDNGPKFTSFFTQDVVQYSKSPGGFISPTTPNPLAKWSTPTEL
jgi:hypothetical protein